jgi:hypothetical protein
MLDPRVYKEGEEECLTACMLCVTAVCMIHDICNDIHVRSSPWNVPAAGTTCSTNMIYSCMQVHAHVAGLGCNVYTQGDRQT